MFRVIRDEIKGQYAVWKYIGGNWKRMSSYYYAESNAINLMKVMAKVMK